MMHSHRSLASLVGLAIVAVLTGIPLCAAQSNSGQSKDWNASDSDRRRALELYEQHRLPEAAALLEKVVARYPRDLVAHERLGVALLSRADTQTDLAKRVADRVQARAELLRAKELGDDSDLCKTLLAEIPEDGSEGRFSEKAEVDAAMKRGEAAFAQGDWDAAIKEYTRAFELDPKLYFAPLDIGDTYFRLKQVDKAGEWFAKAIAVDPDQEVAYRYWGDALLSDGKTKEAREKFIQGLVAYPYRQSSWNGLRNWANANHVKINDLSIQVPAAPTTGANGSINVTVDPASLGKGDDSGAAWLTYSMERELWKSEKFAKEYPQEKSYRHSLKEESSALSQAAAVFDELQKKSKTKTEDPSLTLLSRLKSDGLIEAYVLLIGPDAGIARDYPAYRAANRDKLIRFVDTYVLPPTP